MATFEMLGTLPFKISPWGIFLSTKHIYAELIFVSPGTMYSSFYIFNYKSREWILQKNTSQNMEYKMGLLTQNTNVNKNEKTWNQTVIEKLRKMQFPFESKHSGLYKLVKVNYSKYNRLVVYGYLRRQYASHKIPNDLIKLIQLLYDTEYIHVFNINSSKHWRFCAYLVDE
eukprot:429038_1